MQDLTGRFPASLTPSSQEGGNLIQPDLAKSTMTAPGSEPVTPLPGPVQGSDPDINQSVPTVPVSFPGDQVKPPVQPAPHGGGRWGDIGFGRLWRQL